MMGQFYSFEGVQFFVTDLLPAGQVRKDPVSDYWLVGRGTDLQSALFDANLKPHDRAFLANLKIKVG